MRPPEQVMTLSRLGSLHQCRLSFMRQLLRRLARENWQISRPRFDINSRGEGVAVYTAQGPERSYSLIAFAHDLPDEMRSDRVIATAWDATFTLFDGTPTPDDIERLRANVPLQEAGRVSNKELSLSRANRSARLWDYVVDCLAKGLQPDAAELAKVGYLMRTTAVYGSGKFGASDRAFVAERPEFEAPFQVEMLSVYLTRAFVADLVEHMAALKAPQQAVPLKPSLRRSLGIGNSTGLGMAPFLVNHPRLLNNWITAREYALAKIRALPNASVTDISAFKAAFEKACGSVALWHSDHPIQQVKLAALRKDIAALHAKLIDFTGTAPQPWNALYLWSESALSEEGQEFLVSLLMEPQGALLEGLGACMQADEHALFRIDGAMPLSDLKALIQNITLGLSPPIGKAMRPLHGYGMSLKPSLSRALANALRSPWSPMSNPSHRGETQAFFSPFLKTPSTKLWPPFSLHTPNIGTSFDAYRWLQATPMGKSAIIRSAPA